MTYRSLLAVVIFVLLAHSAFAQDTPVSDGKFTDPVTWLKETELQLANTPSKPGRLRLLKRMAPAALAARDTKKAGAFADELSRLGQELQGTPGIGKDYYSEAVYISNLVLGLIAAKQDRVAMAKEHLLRSGDVPGSSSLSTLGPTMALAELLLEKGENEVVIKFLDQCAKFWNPTTERGQIASWKSAIQNGGIPDFGVRLRFHLNTWRIVYSDQQHLAKKAQAETQSSK